MLDSLGRQDIYSALYIFNFFIAFGCMTIAIFKFMCLLREILPERRFIANIIAPFILFYPNMFTEKGNKCRIHFFIFLSISATCVAIAYGLEQLYGKPPYMEHFNESQI
jgi:hypothetical protein